jgi:hypothetical protein
VGKKNEKNKDKKNRKDDDRPGKKELLRQIERLQAENEALQARLERIAEIAGAPPIASDADVSVTAVLQDGSTA